MWPLDVEIVLYRDTSSLFAAAEEFAHLIEDDAAGSYNATGSHAYANKDNAGQRPLCFVFVFL